MNPWKTADPEQVIEIVHALNAVEWPKTEAETNAILDQHGWHPDPESGMPMSDLGINPAHVFVSDLEEKGTVRVTFSVADTFPSDDVETKADFIQDVFASFAARFRQEWGKPTKTTTKYRPEIWWNLPNGCAVKLVRAKWGPRVQFLTPVGVELESFKDVM